MGAATPCPGCLHTVKRPHMSQFRSTRLSSNFHLVRLVHEELNVTRLESYLYMTPSHTDLQSTSLETLALIRWNACRSSTIRVKLMSVDLKMTLEPG